MSLNALTDDGWGQADLYVLQDEGWVAPDLYVLQDDGWKLVTAQDAGEDPTLTYGTSVSLNSDTSTATFSDRHGIVIEPQTDLAGVRARISSNPSGYSLGHVYEAGGSEVGTVDITDVGNGEEFEIHGDLAAGTQYYVTISDGGDEYTRGRGSQSYPVTSDDIDVVAGVYGNDGPTSTNYRYNIDKVTAIITDSDSDGGSGGSGGGGGGGGSGDEMVFIDDFSRSALSYYTVSDTSGTAQIVDTLNRGDRSYGVELDGYVRAYSGPWEDLPYYPESGYRIRWYFRPLDLDSANQYWWYFGGLDPDNCYRVEYIGEGTFRTAIIEDGERDYFEEDLNSINWQDQWYVVNVFWYTGSADAGRDGYQVFLHEAGYSNWDDYISFLDSGREETTYDGEGIIGFRSSSGGHIYNGDWTRHPL